MSLQICCRSMARDVALLNFNAFLEKEKLKDDGSNFADWLCILRIILTDVQKAYVLDAPLGAPPLPETPADIVNVWQTHADGHSIVQCAILYGLESRLQKHFERHVAYELIEELKMVFQTHARVERYDASDRFFCYKMEENSSVSEHILKMSGYADRLNQLGIKIPDELVIDRVL